MGLPADLGSSRGRYPGLVRGSTHRVGLGCRSGLDTTSLTPQWGVAQVTCILVIDDCALDARDAAVASVPKALGSLLVAPQVDLKRLTVLGHALDVEVGEAEAPWQENVVDPHIFDQVALLAGVLRVDVLLGGDVLELLLVVLLDPLLEQLPGVLSHSGAWWVGTRLRLESPRFPNHVLRTPELILPDGFEKFEFRNTNTTE